ncbi:MAG: LysR family transcriptional regulator [Tabrizicola sp.]|nr:LysR family transcriptional regulator [Tabrizicola sp.]
MQIELLDTFLDLVETRSFHRTAERLRITQSTVSARVTALEQAVGSRLFDRSRAGTDLTPEGKRFEPHARALRHEWNEARRRIQIPLGAAHLLRLGIQNDLAAVYLGDWVAEFRQALPEMSFYIEPDYSNQMCADLLTGILDFAVMFSPNPHPDLHFESVGDVTDRMISTEAGRIAEVAADRFVFAHFSPAFEEMHRQTTPELAASPVSVGQSGSVVSLLLAMGGSGYVLEKTANELVSGGRFQLVEDAAPLRQPVYAAIHIRHRTQALHRKLTQLVGRHFPG